MDTLTSVFWRRYLICAFGSDYARTLDTRITGPEGVTECAGTAA